MDYNENGPKPEENPQEAQPTVMEGPSTARRTATAILVLVAALLLGYVLYDLLLNHPDPVAETEVEAPKQYTEAEKRAILEAMQDPNQGEISTEEEQERRQILKNMNSDSSDEVSEEERLKILQAM